MDDVEIFVNRSDDDEGENFLVLIVNILIKNIRGR